MIKISESVEKKFLSYEGLSHYTDILKPYLTKLNGIDTGAQVNAIEVINIGDATLSILNKTVTITKSNIVSLLGNEYATTTDYTSLKNLVNQNEDNIVALQNQIGSGSGLTGRIVALENFADTKGKANGITPLDANNKIPLEFLSDEILGQLTYNGTVNGGRYLIENTLHGTKILSIRSSFSNKFEYISYDKIINDYINPTTDENVYLLEENPSSLIFNDEEGNEIVGEEAKGKFVYYNSKHQVIYVPNDGDYFIVSAHETASGADSEFYFLDIENGDWIVSNGPNSFGKVDNSDSVTLVAGLKGNISVSSLKLALGIENVDNTADANKSVAESDKAYKDGNGNTISTTYASKSSVATNTTNIANHETRITAIENSFNEFVAITNSEIDLLFS